MKRMNAGHIKHGVRFVCFYQGLPKGFTQRMAHDYIDNMGDGGKSQCVPRRQTFNGIS